MSVLLAIRWAATGVATTVPAVIFFNTLIYNDIVAARSASDCEKADKSCPSVSYPLLQAMGLADAAGEMAQKSPPVTEGREARIE
jgi:hypothetical protein